MIRPATLGDAEEFARVKQTSFDRPFTADDFKKILGNGCLGWMAVHNSCAVGFLLIQPIADEAEILSLSTVPETRRTGIAYALLDAAFAELSDKKTKSLFLEVSVENEAAIKLYQKTGFVQVGVRPRYYQTGEKLTDAFIMKKELL